jgi:CDP-diacylglycerol--serine O-phosphatidyltransferase
MADSTARSQPPRVARWRYVVPNALTCASLTVGLAAIVIALTRQDFTEAAWLVILSTLLDKLDGTAARALGATSDIGVQLDSFADFVTFGIAPAAMLYAAGEHARAIGQPTLWSGEAGGLALAALTASFVLCACLRLAKFNVLTENLPPDAPKVFYGMPSTFAGGLLAILYLLADKYGLAAARDALPIVAGLLGLLMVSNWPLPKLARRHQPVLDGIQVLTVIGTYVCGIARIFPEYLAFNVITFALVGFGWGFVHRKRLLAARRLDPYPDAEKPA